RAGVKWQCVRKYERWCQGGRVPKAVEDQRPTKSGRFRAPKLSGEDRDKLVGKAVLSTGGRIAQAWRELRDSNGLSEDLLGHYIANPSRKSYVPKTIRDLVKYKVAALDDIHHGP